MLHTIPCFKLPFISLHVWRKIYHVLKILTIRTEPPVQIKIMKRIVCSAKCEDKQTIIALITGTSPLASTALQKTDTSKRMQPKQPVNDLQRNLKASQF